MNVLLVKNCGLLVFLGLLFGIKNRFNFSLFLYRVSTPPDTVSRLQTELTMHSGTDKLFKRSAPHAYQTLQQDGWEQSTKRSPRGKRDHHGVMWCGGGLKFVLLVMVHQPCGSQSRRCEQLWNLPPTVHEQSLSMSVVVVYCDVKFSSNVVDDSQEWSSTSTKMTVFHVRQPSQSSANVTTRTNLAPERGLTEQGTVKRSLQNSLLIVCGVLDAKQNKITLNMQPTLDAEGRT